MPGGFRKKGLIEPIAGLCELKPCLRIGTINVFGQEPQGLAGGRKKELKISIRQAIGFENSLTLGPDQGDLSGMIHDLTNDMGHRASSNATPARKQSGLRLVYVLNFV